MSYYSPQSESAVSPKLPGRSTFARYGVAVAAVTLAGAARMSLTPLWGPTDLPFIFFYPAIVVAAWYGRRGPALLAIVLSTMTAAWFFIEPVHSFALRNPSELIAIICFMIVNLMLVVVIELMHTSKDEVTTEQIMFATTLTSIGDAVIATDATGKVRSLNPEAVRLTGWTEAAATGKPLSDVFKILNEQTRQPVENPVEKVLRLGTIAGLANHTVLVTKEGREIPIDDSAAPIRQPGGSVLGVVLVFRDVSEQRRAQRDQARLAEVVKYSGDAIITKDLNGIIDSWNDSAKRLFGYEAEEIVGKPATVLFPPDRLSEEDSILARLRQGQPSERLETIRLTKDGKPIHVSVSVSPLKDGNDEIIGASKIIHDITALVTAREQLIREKELLATTLASIGDAVILTDEQGHITFLNVEAERLTAWPNQEAYGRSLNEVFRIINEETREAVENPVEKVMRLGGVVGLANHTVLISRDGREIPIDDSAAPIRNPGGPMFGIVLVFRDFSERKQAEETLRASAERAAADLLALKRLQAVGAQCARANTDFAECLNGIIEAAIAITGADKGNVQLFDTSTGRLTIAAQHGFEEPFLNFFNQVGHGDAAACGVAMASSERVIVEDVAQSEIFIGQPSLQVMLNAGVRAVQSTPLISSRNRVMGMISTHFAEPHRPDERQLQLIDLLARQVADYLERQRAEEALREREERFRRMANSAPVLIWLSGTDKLCTWFNRQWLEFTGRTMDQELGNGWAEGVHEDDFERCLQTYVTAFDKREPFKMEYRLRRHDGDWRWVLDHGVPLYEGDDVFCGYIGSCIDITDSKLAEEQRDRLLESEQELRHTAEETNRLKDEFLAIMSHELRNPLNVILGYSELFLLSDEIRRSPQLRQMGEAIKRNAQTQSRLIRDLLDLSRLRSGKISLNRETVSLLTVVNNAVETVRGDATAKQITIDVTVPDEIMFVEGDQVRLEQIIWNLLNNSVKFTPDGGRIEVHINKGDDEALVTVQDTGQGIDAAFLPHVFELFRQADASTRRAQSGMGIGLAIAQQLVDLHNGTISAFSAGKNQGATFNLKLPLSLKPKAPAASGLDLTTTLEKISVLVVDDSEDTTEMLAHLLKMSGAVVTGATSAEEGLRIIRENEFDVVLSDISMPGMDGFEFLRKLRLLPGRSEVPVLALTGFGRPEDIERAKAEGFYSHVTKPFELEALIAILQKLPRRRSNGGNKTSLN